MTKPTLYTFPRSSWSASARIARIELGLGDMVDVKQLDFLKAENMSPTYITMTRAATVPALSTHGNTCCDTTQTIEHMINLAAINITPRTSLTAAVHHSCIDSKFMTFAARNKQELAAKAALGPPLLALTSRLQRVKAYATLPQAAPFREQYATKIAYIERLISIYTFTAPCAVISEFYVASCAVWDAARVFLHKTLPTAIIGSGPFVAGAEPGEDDFHVIGWVVHAGFLAGAQHADDILGALEKFYGVEVPEKVTRLVQAWLVRESFRKTYMGGNIW